MEKKDGIRTSGYRRYKEVRNSETGAKWSTLGMNLLN